MPKTIEDSRMCCGMAWAMGCRCWSCCCCHGATAIAAGLGLHAPWYGTGNGVVVVVRVVVPAAVVVVWWWWWWWWCRSYGGGGYLLLLPFPLLLLLLLLHKKAGRGGHVPLS